MRWQRLFADIEAELDGVARADLDDEIVVQTRRRRGQIQLLDRLRIERGTEIDVRVRGAGLVRGVLGDIGSDWILLVDDAGGELLIPASSILAAFGMGHRAVRAGPQDRLHSLLNLRYALKTISQDRSRVRVTLSDGALLTGTLDWVGADFVDIADRAPGEGAAARGHPRMTVPLGEMCLLRRV